jgi:hypothetical protein
VVRASGYATSLRHLVRHSADGFELGYAGSGPSDLARSIIGDFLAMADPDPRVYLPFRAAFLADPTMSDGVDITVGAIMRWMESLKIVGRPS